VTDEVSGPEIVGRGDELESINEFLDASAAGFAALILRGPAGIGKTVLLRSAVAAAATRGHQILSAAPTSAETALTFGGLADLLGDVVATAGPGLPAPQRRALQSALLLDDSEASSHAIAAGCVTLLRVLSRQRPVLLAVDDAQWLDPVTAMVLTYAFRRLGDERVGLVVTHRDDTRTTLPLGLLDAQVVDSRVLDVSPLSIGALHRLLGVRLGAAFARPVVRRIHETSVGNAFVALELARSLHGQPAPPSPSGPLPLPSSVRDLILERLGVLAPDVHEELRLLAAAGDLTVDQLTEAADHPDRLESTLDAAIAEGFLEMSDGHVRFAHPLYGSTIYAEVPPFERRRLHGRLAEVARDPESRARHLALATEGPDAAAADELEQASHLAQRRGAPISAAALAEMAASLTPHHDSERQRARLVDASDSHMAAGNPARARAILDGLIADLLPGPARARMLLRRADVSGDDVAEQTALCEQALVEAGGDPGIQAPVHLELATLSWLGGDFRGAADHATRAIESAERSGDRLSLAIALGELAHAETNLTGRIPDAIVTRAMELEQDLPTFPPFRRPSYRYGVLRSRIGDVEGGRPLMVAELERARALGDEGSLPGILCYLTDLERRAGRWAQAAAHLAEAVTLSRQASVEQEQQAVRVRMAFEAAYLGNVDRCREIAASAVPIAHQAGWRLIELQHLGALGLLELSLGDPAAAHERLAPATAILLDMGVVEVSQYGVIENDVEAMVAIGELQGARQLIDRIRAGADAADLGWLQALAVRGEALRLAAYGDLRAARRTIAEALGLHEHITDPFEHARTQLIAGGIERRARQKSSAREPLELALATFERLGAREWAARAREELERVGGRPPSSGELTAAESQVAELVATGLSNPEVAAQLHITRKTVEKHLSRVYSKLGVRSRVELTRHLLADDPPRQ